jgi:hypothetical protein
MVEMDGINTVKLLIPFMLNNLLVRDEYQCVSGVFLFRPEFRTCREAYPNSVH